MITGNIKINSTSSLTLYLAFRIFDSIRHHYVSGTFKKMYFGKGKIRNKGFNLTKKWFHSNKILNQSLMFMFLFFCISNFLVLTILQPETVKLNFTKSCILIDEVGVLALLESRFYMGRWYYGLFILTINCNSRNYCISVSSLK